MRRLLIASYVCLVTVMSVSAIGPGRGYSVGGTWEYGFVKVWKHTLQLGENGWNFDFVRQGGQEILFPVSRSTLELTLAGRHDIIFLYQPLTFMTKTRVPQTLAGGITIGGTVFPAGTGLDLKYGFDFWRVSYLYNFLANDRWRVGAGLSLQLRNASIVFESTSGEEILVTQNLGPVPILKFRAEYRFPSRVFVGTEVDGFYASSSFFNGASFDFEGSILDASVRAGVPVWGPFDAFLNVRFLGGTAKGTAQYEERKWTESPEPYSNNVLATTTLTLGIRLR